MEILNLIYNETVNHLEEVAPGRNWSRRIVVPLSHDYGGCVNFGLTTTEKKHRIVGERNFFSSLWVIYCSSHRVCSSLEVSDRLLMTFSLFPFPLVDPENCAPPVGLFFGF